MGGDVNIEEENSEENYETDHDLILTLKTKIENLEVEIQETENNLETSLTEQHETATQLALHEKLSAQHTLLRHIFYGVIILVICMWVLVFVGWVTGQEAIEREMAFFERIILVFIGIVGGAVSSFFDVRNFTLPNNINGGNGKVKKPVSDTE